MRNVWSKMCTGPHCLTLASPAICGLFRVIRDTQLLTWTKPVADNSARGGLTMVDFFGVGVGLSQGAKEGSGDVLGRKATCTSPSTCYWALKRRVRSVQNRRSTSTVAMRIPFSLGYGSLSHSPGPL